MLKKILIGLVLIIAVLAVVVAMQPDEYRVMRSTTINAPPAAAFEQVNDFHNWDKWSPWTKLDPAMKLTIDGAPSGTGATYAWAGDSNVGEGRMTIVESRPNELVKIDMEFIKPFAGTAVAGFAFKPEGEQTLVTWSMEGKKNFIAKAIHLVMNMDKMIGGMFEQGLAQIKATAEAAPK